MSEIITPATPENDIEAGISAQSEISDQITIVLDATMLDTYLLCPQKFYLRHRLNRVPPDLAKPLDRGQLIHTGFEGYYKAVQRGDKFEQAMEVLISTFNMATTESQLDHETTSAIKERMLEAARIHRAYDFRVEILAVEESFVYELYSDKTVRILMMGKIDLLVNDPVGGYERLPIDHKSYERDYPVHRKTNQFCNYSYAMRSNYLLVNRVGMQTSIPPDKKHKRVILSYDPVFHEQWKQNVIKWCYRYLESEAMNEWPLNDTSCDKFNRLCEYYPICDTSGEESKQFKINVQYKLTTPWDVGKSLGKQD